MARNTRSAMFGDALEIATHLPSLVSYALRGALAGSRLPTRPGDFPKWLYANVDVSISRASGSMRFTSISWPAAPVYDAEQLLRDEHLRARGTFVAVDDPALGAMTVQAPVAVLSDTPGRIDFLGRALGADNDEVYGGLLGVSADRLEALRAAGTI